MVTKINQSYYKIAIGSIVHCWEVVESDTAGQDRKSGGRVLLTSFGLKSGV